MSTREALYQSLATSGAVLLSFIGVCHEVVGPQLFPWAPDALGVAWHAIGVFGIIAGILMAAATLRLIHFPVFATAVVAGAIGLAVALFTGFTHGEFHMFAFAVVLAAIATAVFHRKATGLAAAADQGSSHGSSAST